MPRVHVRPLYMDRPAVPVPVWLAAVASGKPRDWSLRWGQMRPEEPAVIMPLADWLLLAGIAAMVALSAMA
jgi:hypothetical protein